MSTRLKEIEERLNAITPGKWKYIVDYDHYIITDNNKFIAQTTYDDLSMSKEHNIEADSEFIAHAPEDIAYLLELIKGTKS